MAKIRKVNAVLGLLSAATLLVHVAYTVYAYLAFYFNPVLKLWTAIPFMVVTCLHSICGMTAVFMQTDGTSLHMYPGHNLGTVLQRLSAALILPLLILHINTYELLRVSADSGRWFFFALLMAGQPLFYATVLTHITTSLSKALITLGWLSSRKTQRKLDWVLYMLGAVVFVVATIVVLRTELVIFLWKGGGA